LISTSPERLAVTVSEAAGMLGLSRAKFYQLILRGEIRSLKIDKCRRVPVREIESFIDRQIDLESVI
jgi:excisionase family DNA binding protein